MKQYIDMANEFRDGKRDILHGGYGTSLLSVVLFFLMSRFSVNFICRKLYFNLVIRYTD